MKKIIRYLAGIILTFGVALGILVLAPDTAQAAGAYVYEYSDMIGQGGYIYYIRSSASGTSASIWRMKVSTGETSKVVSAPRGIVKLIVSGQQLYYTTVNDEDQWETRTCRLNGDDVQAVCEGVVCYADSEKVYYIGYVQGTQVCLYVKDLTTGECVSLKKVKADQTLDYVCNIGAESYYYIYDRTTDKLYLYRLHTATNKFTRVASEKRVAEGTSGLMVSDVRQISGELYYDYGSYEGSGGFWNGTIKKLTVDGKKKTVVKLTADDKIIAGSKELYFSTPKGDNYKYHINTGKKTKYSLKFEQNIGYTVLGDKTYMSDTSNKNKIVISRFTSGTDRETLTKNFISIPFKQKADISYGVSMKQVGIYNMICVTGTDFSPKYGWRGKMVSVNWFITDGAGTLLGSFQ